MDSASDRFRDLRYNLLELKRAIAWLYVIFMFATGLAAQAVGADAAELAPAYVVGFVVGAVATVGLGCRMSIRGVGGDLLVSNGLTSKRIPTAQISEICSVSRFYWTEPVVGICYGDGSSGPHLQVCLAIPWRRREGLARLVPALRHLVPADVHRQYFQRPEQC